MNKIANIFQTTFLNALPWKCQLGVKKRCVVLAILNLCMERLLALIDCFIWQAVHHNYKAGVGDIKTQRFLVWKWVCFQSSLNFAPNGPFNNDITIVSCQKKILTSMPKLLLGPYISEMGDQEFVAGLYFSPLFIREIPLNPPTANKCPSCAMTPTPLRRLRIGAINVHWLDAGS